MKHPILINIKLFMWLIFSVVLAHMFRPAFVRETSNLIISPVVLIITIVVVIFISTYFWIKIIGSKKEHVVDFWYPLLLSFVATKGIIELFKNHIDQSINPFILLFGLGFIGISLIVVMYRILLRATLTMRKSWKASRKFTPIINLVFIWVCVVAAISISNLISFWTALGLLIALSVYDAWAVWKSRTMIKLAKFFVEKRFFPGIAVAYPHKKKFAFLGGGDVFLIAILSITALQISVVASIIITLFMLSSILVLLLFSSEHKFYPALPVILVGVILSLIVLVVSNVMIGGIL